MDFRKIFFGLFVAGAILVGSNSAHAVDARTYSAGNIIDDAVFSNSDSMTVAQIQSFFESKVSCDNYGRKTSELGGGTRAQWLAARGYSTPIRCITDYVENPTTGENNYGKTTEVSGGLSAAQIIYNYAKQFNINPQALIVTLQKENGMITDEWPTLKQFQESMGFGCPDNVAAGAPACDPRYKSFASQIYQAARHFRGYMDAKPGWYVTFNTGWQTVGYHPNSACGGSSVYIENRATVALYTYTPYQPNQAALNAQYGTGDRCSSYGNRNFYNYFNDWFGSTRSSQIVRTVSNGSLYLISGSNKYYIASMETFNQLSRISNSVAYVSQEYLDSFATSGTISKIVRNIDTGAIYLIDNGSKYHFTSCETVSDYGFSCDNVPNLTSVQIDKFTTKTGVTNFAKVDGRLFYIKNGKKAEIIDETAMQNAGLSGAFIELSSSAINGLAYSKPIIRSDILIQNSSNGALYYVDETNKLRYVNGEIFDILSGKIEIKSLEASSVEKLDIGEDFYNLVQDETGEKFVFGEGKKFAVNVESSKITKISNELSSKIPRWTGGTQAVMFENSATVYYLNGNNLHKIFDWTSVLSLNPDGKIIKLNASTKSIFTESSKAYISTNQLIKVADSPTVYMIDGFLGSKKYLGSFEISKNLGLRESVMTIHDGSLKHYEDSGVVRTLVNCSGDLYLASGGKLKYFSGQQFEQFGVSIDRFEKFSPEACSKFEKSGSVTNFLLGGNGAIYIIKDGVKQHIRSYSKFIELGGSKEKLLSVDDYILNSIKTGAQI